jgi:uncharacterized membrane protein YqjE
MEPNEQRPPSLMGSVRRIADALLSTLQNRVELFEVELQEEKARLVTTLLWTVAAAFFGLLAVIFITATIVILSPEKARPYVLISFTVIYVVLFIAAVRSLKRQIKDRPPAFSDSVTELKKDIAWIRSKN